MRRARHVAGLLSMLAFPSATQAFSEPLLYGEATSMGGGGGRFFTGSPLDSFSCAVCHEGKGVEPPTVRLRGFPERYEAGESYDIELEWTRPAQPHALNLEIIDTEGQPAGIIELPEGDDADEDVRCILSEDEAQRDQLAASVVEQGSRRIVSVLGCGSRALRFKFKAPKQGAIALTAGIVRSNQKQDNEGDGVLELRRIARREDEVAPPVEGCASSTAQSGFAVLPLTALALLLRRRRRRAAVT